MSEILNPNNFWNLVFLVGTGLIVMSATRISIPVPWRKDQRLDLSRVPKGKQTLFCALGVFLVVIAVLMAGFSHWAGLVSPKASGVPGKAVGSVTTWILLDAGGIALADSSDSHPVAQLDILQRHVALPEDRLKGLGIYIGDIHLFQSSVLIVFRADDTDLDIVREYRPNDIRERVRDKEVLIDDRISRGDRIVFEFDGTRYVLQARLRWYVVGEDFAEVTVRVAERP